VLLEYKVRVEGELDLTYERIYEVLGDCRIDEVEVNNIKEKRLKIVEPDKIQMKILKILGYEDMIE
jgi:hypothetical protein